MFFQFRFASKSINEPTEHCPIWVKLQLAKNHQKGHCKTLGLLLKFGQSGNLHWLLLPISSPCGCQLWSIGLRQSTLVVKQWRHSIILLNLSLFKDEILFGMNEWLTSGSQVGLRLDRTFCTLQAPKINNHATKYFKMVQPKIWHKYLTWCCQMFVLVWPNIWPDATKYLFLLFDLVWPKDLTWCYQIFVKDIWHGVTNKFDQNIWPCATK